MTTHILARLIRAECNRVLGMATLQADFEQTGKLYTRSKLVAMQCFGSHADDWQRCLALYRTLHPGELYMVSGDTLAASDGTVLLLGTTSMRPVPRPMTAAATRLFAAAA